MAFLFDPDLAESNQAPGTVASDPVTGEALDCTRCGACCQTGQNGTLLLEPADLLRWRRSGRSDLASQTVEGHFSTRALPTDEQGVCRYFTSPNGRSLCSIYEDRATVCREFRAGSWQCLEFRRTRAASTLWNVDLMEARRNAPTRFSV